MTAPKSVTPASFLREQLDSASPDQLREMVKTFAEALMSAEADAVCGAPYGVRSDERVNSRNGYRARECDTHAATGWEGQERDQLGPVGRKSRDDRRVVAFPQLNVTVSTGKGRPRAPRTRRSAPAHVMVAGRRRGTRALENPANGRAATQCPGSADRAWLGAGQARGAPAGTCRVHRSPAGEPSTCRPYGSARRADVRSRAWDCWRTTPKLKGMIVT